MTDSEIVTPPLGCPHYKRKCQLVAPCCQQIYTCRFCHNEKEDHEINRKEVEDVVCLMCRTQQKVARSCTSCKVVFGNYFCEVCRLFDDEDKKQFHCDQCGICRVGGRNNFFHCPKCDLCLPKKLRDKHKCVEKASKANCPVCLEDLHSSIVPSHVPPCSHLIHRTCFEDMLSNGHYTCPVCSISMVNMKPVWEKLDEEVAATAMPTEYADLKVDILCRDCHKESLVLFHVIGLKCSYCGSYNTCRSGGAHHTHVENDETDTDEDKNNADSSQLDRPSPDHEAAPCCNKTYTCRFCHDENEPTHQLQRRLVMEIKCMNCSNIQNVAQRCFRCDMLFGKYFCSECRLFDDDNSKQQFHCRDCQICRVGGRNLYYHCKVCDYCIHKSLRDTHKCVEKASRSECPICLENLHESRERCTILRCGHLIHGACLQKLKSENCFSCPTCRADARNGYETIDGI